MIQRKSRPLTRNVHVLSVNAKKRHTKKVLWTWSLRLSLLAISMTLVGFATHWGVDKVKHKAIYNNPRFALKEVEVDSRDPMIRRDVVRISRLSKGQNIMSIDLKRVQQDVEKLPYIASARVLRELNGCKIQVRIVERIPIARINWKSQGIMDTFYLDRDCVLMKPRSTDGLNLLPEITGCRWQDPAPGQKVEVPEVISAVTLLKLIEGTSLRSLLMVQTLDVGNPLALQMTTSEGMRASFRPSILDQQLQRLFEILEFSRERQRQVATVDLTLDRNVPVVFMN